MKTLEKRFYNALNDLADYCGGIEAFIAEGRDEVWKAKGYHDVFACCMGGRRVMVGYQFIMNGDVVSDPAISVDLTERGTADLSTIVIDTLLGVLPATAAKDADIHYAVGVIERMAARLKAGTFTLVAEA